MRSVSNWVFVATLMAGSAVGQDWAKAQLDKSLRRSTWVKITHGNRAVDCFIAYPQVKDPATAVLVIHDSLGLTDWVRSVSDQLAKEGYIAITPDLLSGAAPGGGGTAHFSDADAVSKALASLPPDQITADLKAARDYVAKLPSCNGKVAAAGFGWGGGQCFRYATNDKELRAAFVFYGAAPTKVDELARIGCTIYGFYASKDSPVTDTIASTAARMAQAAQTFQPLVYGGSGGGAAHGFMLTGEAPDATTADKKFHDLAWVRWKSTLKGL